MRPKEWGEIGQQYLFRTRLDHIIDRGHPPSKFANAIEWRFLANGSAGSFPTCQVTRLGRAALCHVRAISTFALVSYCWRKSRCVPVIIVHSHGGHISTPLTHALVSL